MKVGANVTPPAGTPPAPQLAPRIKKATPGTPPPALTTPPPLVVTPPPVLAAPRPSVAAYRRTSVPVPVVDPSVPAASKGKTMLVTGLCMIAFSCGVMTTEAVERFWPRSRAGASAAATPGSGPGFELRRDPAIPAAQPAQVTPLPAADPDPADHAPPASSAVGRSAAEVFPAEPAVPPASVAPAPRVGPVAKVAPAPRAAAPAPKATTPPAAHGPVARGVAAVRVPPAQGRVAGRKRQASNGSASATGETQSPTEGWADPFAQ